MQMTQQIAAEYPSTASILALIGGVLIILSGGLLLAVSTFILPNLDYANLAHPANIANMGGLVSGAVGMVGFFGVVCGGIVILSAVMLQMSPERRKMWSALALIFSVVSFFSLGGFVVGAVLGLVGGAMALTWKPSAPRTQPM